jgi:hypothetical protein
MVQHLVVDPVQSPSTWQSLRPPDAVSQTFCAPGTSDRSTHAWPMAVLHLPSSAQKIGQVDALWHTLLPEP